MKFWQMIIQQLVQWWQQLSVPAFRWLFQQTRQIHVQIQIWRQAAQRLPLKVLLQSLCHPNRLKRKKYSSRKLQRPILLIIAIVVLTSALGYRFYNEPQLAADTVAPQTLRAPASVKVVDTKTTEINRKAARVAAVPVLMIDQAANQDVYRSLQRLLSQGNDLRSQAGAFPFIDPSVLSTATQLYLRRTEEWNWRTALAKIEGVGVTPALPKPTAPKPTAPKSPAGASRPPTAPITSANRLNPNSEPADSAGTNQANSSSNNSSNSNPDASLQLAILELQSYRQSTSLEDFSALTEVILRARQRYAETVAALSAVEPTEPSFYDATLLNLTDSEWNKTREKIRTVVERILSQGVAPGIPDSILEAAVQTQVGTDLPPSAIPIATHLLVSVIKPNLVQDPEQTKLRAEQAAQAVDAVVVEIQRGEVIVQAGERISQSDFVLLDHFGLSRRRLNWLGLLGFSGLIATAAAIFWIVEQRSHSGLRRRDYCLVLLLVLTAPLVVALNFPSMNLAAIGLLIGSFYGAPLGVATVGMLSLILPIGTEISWTNLIASALAGLLGAGLTGQIRSREELAMLGGAVGLTQGLVYLLLTLMLSSAATPVWYVVLTTAALQSLLGLTWSIIALGLSPYLERLFDLVTPMRLAELSNPNRPMLKRLASEAPGTFQHTLFVATLAEAAARALGCNVELVRAGTLYHDIGKMHDPLGFIENQMGEPNKHDALDDPWQSAAIIKKHVSEGLVMARKCRLPKAIQAFIPEHQGTMPISYFYHQALERAKTDATILINEMDFHYNGPIPQSRETGIVMLADSCEAALRSLKDATPDAALAMVNRILRARWQDHQLVDSGLSRAEMSCIAEIFVQVWQQSNHQRIPYPNSKMGLGSQGS